MKNSQLKLSKDQEKLKTSWFVAFAFSMLALFACNIPQVIVSGTHIYTAMYETPLSEYGVYTQIPLVKYIRVLAVGINHTFHSMLPNFGDAWMMCMGAWLIAPIFEELEFRGLLWWFNKKMSKGWYIAASLVSSLIFALCHDVPPGYCITILLGGLTFCWLIRQTGRIWPSMLCHSVYNFQIFFIAMAGSAKGAGLDGIGLY
jgi:membrane protease YdiL (CAAX protease family)